ncbi:hypothetical protein [Streptomyces sp. SID3343]|uniref:hypothetical protein n=1 Tax=Streptomyces sp. SID3343 TaxID=2690260 RepID=UPI00136DDB62|nr:hypothetical protein [Streptomyces sp. SID3343]MYW04809.1 hypothetical protein [Streptomyces sp. SID3343]
MPTNAGAASKSPSAKRRWSRATRVQAGVVVLTLALVGGQQAWDTRQEAQIPDTLCDGLLSTAAVAPGFAVSEFDDEVRRTPSPGSPAAWCRLGELVEVRADLLPIAREEAYQVTRRVDATSFPLGPGLEGMAGPGEGWLVLPCPKVGRGDPVLVTLSFRGNWNNGTDADDDRLRLARWITDAGRRISARAGCGAESLPEPALPAADEAWSADLWKGKGDPREARRLRKAAGYTSRPIDTGGLCGLAPATLLTPAEAEQVQAWMETPRNDLVYTCQLGGSNFLSPESRFTVVSGALRAYAPLDAEPGESRARGGASDSTWTAGTCAGRPAVFTFSAEWVQARPDGVRRGDRVETIFRALVDGYAKRAGCSVP